MTLEIFDPDKEEGSMKPNRLNRMAVLVISTMSLAGMSIPANAQQQPQEEQKQPHKQPQQQEPSQKQSEQDQKRQQQQEQKRTRQQAQEEQRQQEKQSKEKERLQRQSEEKQKRQEQQQQERARQQAQEEQRKQRKESQEKERIQRQSEEHQRRLRDERFDYDRDPYFYAAPIYRYRRGGRYYEINRYGANVLRQALHAGYAQGFRAGEADRRDRWRAAYRDSYAYRDASYGYRGYYISRSEYNYYFREGFRRGYEDGYNSRYRYGRYANDNYFMSDNILSQILNFESIR